MNAVGIDIDGTISRIPDIFSILSHGLKARGIPVHIITFRDEELEEQTLLELRGWNIHYDALHFAPRTAPSAAIWKASIVEKYHIDVMFEDSPEVLQALPGHVAKTWIFDTEIYDLRKVIEALSP